MKKSLIVSITLICLAFIFHAHAQIVSDDSGNVGIGVSNPSTELEVNGVITTTGGDSDDWNSVFGWGDHSTAGYLTSYTETDPIFGASAASGISSGNITNWNTAFGWGDHGSAGYLTSEVDGSTSNELQNIFSTVTGDTGTTTANEQADTLNIVGSGTVSTGVSGDTLTITGTGGSGGGVTTYINGSDASSTYGLTLVGEDYLGYRHYFLTSQGYHWTVSSYAKPYAHSVLFQNTGCTGTSYVNYNIGPGSVFATNNYTAYWYLPKTATMVSNQSYWSRYDANASGCIDDTISRNLGNGYSGAVPNVSGTTGISSAALPPGTTYSVTH